MRVQTSTLVGPALNFAVAKCLGESLAPQCWHLYNYTEDREQGGRLFDDRVCQMTTERDDKGGVQYRVHVWAFSGSQTGPTPMLAALRTIVASHYGESVDMPPVLAETVPVVA